jgi:Tol biopolymer transport system component
LNARWSADGRQVFYDAAYRPTPGIYRKRSDGTGPEELVWKTTGKLADVSKAGELLVDEEHSCLVVEPNGQPGPSWQVSDLEDRAAGSLTESVVLRSSSACGRFSEDGRFIAYTLYVSGRPEVYVVPFPEGTPRIQVSRDGGREPRWRRDGRELFYVSPGGSLMAVRLTRAPHVEASAPAELFHGGTLTSGPYPTFSVSSDGQHFLMIDPAMEPHGDRLTLITHWSDTLKR